MRRRGALVGLGAALFGARAGSSVAMAPPADMGVTAGYSYARSALGGETGIASPVQAQRSSAGERVFNAAYRRLREQHMQRQEVAGLLGGMPPHLASMHSNAAWFRAQATVRWRREQTSTVDAAVDELRRTIFGEEPL